MGIRAALRFVREETGMPIQQLEMLLLVATHPGAIQYAVIGEELGMTQPAVSRNARKLCTQHKKEKGTVIDVGHGLLRSYPDPLEPRNMMCDLSADGKKFINQFYELAKGR